MDWGLSVEASLIAAISFGATLLACRLVRHLGVVDAPDGARKTQAHAVPRLGGLAIALGAGLALIPATLFGGAPVADPGAHHVSLLIAALTGLVFAVGLWDDVWTANTKLKLVVTAAACIAVAILGLQPEALTTPFGDITLPAVLIIGSSAWLLVFINAVNFMDGANGFAMGSLAIMFCGLALTGTVAGNFELTLWWFALLGGFIAFLSINLRGRLYAGDAGALGAGALFASLGLVSGLSIWTIATLALPFLIDVLMTLIWRAKHGRNWLEPHLDHAYQRMIAAGWSHLDVSILYWGLSAVSAIAAYIAAQGGGDAPFAVFWALCVAGILLWIRHRRAAE